MKNEQLIAHCAGLSPALVTWRESADSTNLLLRELALGGAAHGSIVAAGQQTAGRGRGEKRFFSPPEGGAYISVLLRANLPPAGTLPVTLRAALAVRRVMLRHGVALGIKWVNDLWRGGRKVCGILCQAVGGTDCIVAGIGLNLYPAAPPPEELTGIIGYCAENANTLPPPAQITGEIAAELLRLCDGVRDNDALLAEYHAACVLLGRQVEYEENGRVYTALAKDITPAGALVLHTPEGCKILASGTVRMA